MSRANKRRTLFILAVAVGGAAASVGLKTVLAGGIPSPSPLYYAGTLTENGTLASGPHDITLNIWSAETGGTMLCQTLATGQNMASVTNGRFRIALDPSCKTAINQNSNTWVEVVAGATVLPRSPIGAVPYAVEADRASGAAGTLAQQIVPSGAVMAFNLAACPAGWSAFSAGGGRTIIGVTAGGIGLSQRNLGDTVGEEAHTMTVSELPAHTHTASDSGHTHSVGQGILLQLNSAGACGLTCAAGNVPVDNLPEVTDQGSANITVQSAGSGNAFNQMQPSIALLYCSKN